MQGADRRRSATTVESMTDTNRRAADDPTRMADGGQVAEAGESASERAARATPEDAGDRKAESPHGMGAESGAEPAGLKRARAVGQLLDSAFRLPGTDVRVGLDPILGVLPVAGDAVAAALSLYPVVEAHRHDVPKATLAKMLALVGIDAVVGSVPVLGPVFDTVWRANEWNVRTLERHLGGN